MPEEAFLFEYCEKKHGRLYIRTGGHGYCIFYDEERKCMIHPVKPQPCTLWPFYPALLWDPDNWEMAKGACPGINPDCPFEDFLKQSKK
jgi:Fe-S-cluster containining protein